MRTVGILGLLAIGLGACTSPDTASRSAAGPDYGLVAPVTEPVALAGFDVTVPAHLTVSEANAYLPRGEIVWRGDPAGDRHAQVAALFRAGAARAQAGLASGRPVTIGIEVRRFHAITEKARYTTGGVHHMVFDLAVRDAETGALVRPVKTVTTDIVAYGGRKAIEAEARGETQKARLTAHIARVVTEELTLPGGHRNARLGLIQALNRGL
ncbi:DUF6778 family protein [Roseivivax marinus]|uniref:DUF6778 family protein n=1 Tax=Roseivivax marinus TaxID=1379903 RepID=UPI00273F13AC|nr:DUF6778 family protein [Roseivivax marinus]